MQIVSNPYQKHSFGQNLTYKNTAEKARTTYIFGYQGSEMDNEVKDGGNSYTTFFRQLDPRLGRWFSIDPVFQPWQSPYCSMDNNPIGLNDPMGDVADKKEKKEQKQASKQQKSLAKRILEVQKASRKLSEKERKEAYKYAKKNGGTVNKYVDDLGNTRYTVNSAYYTPSNTEFPWSLMENQLDNLVITNHSFNYSKWKKIRASEKAIATEINYSTEMYINRAANIRDAYTLSVGGNLILGGGGSINVGVVYFTRGKDKGFHFMLQTGQGIGLAGGGGVNIGMYDHYQAPKDMKNDFQGVGFQGSGDVVFGASGSFSLDSKNNPTWIGGGVGIGPGFGGSMEITHTGLNGDPTGFK